MKVIKITNKESIKRMRQALTNERIGLLHFIKENKPKSLNDLSRMVHRDYSTIYKDATFLEAAGLLKIEKTRDGSKPIVDYDKLSLEIII